MTKNDINRNYDGLMPWFVFHDALGDSKATRRFLRELASGLEEVIADLVSQRKMIPDTTPIQARLALEAGLEQRRASARWARKSMRHFSGDWGDALEPIEDDS